MNFRFTVQGIPVAQPRQRMRNAGKFIQNYTPKAHPVTQWKKSILMEFVRLRETFLIPSANTPLEISLHFIMPRPKAHFRSNGELRADMPLWHVARPDTDNLAKSVLDALKDAGGYHDDSQVSILHISKRYSADYRERCGVIITCQEV